VADKLRTEIERTLAQVPIDFGGGSSVTKTYLMGWLIRRLKLTTSLDIGVYRGRSLFPQAIAHKHAAGGVVYGVDPWSATDADEHDHHELREQIREFVTTTDFEALYQSVLENAKKFGLSDNIRIVRNTSASAAEKFKSDGVSFGLIHIDGNHDTALVLRDVELYLPLLQPGGIIVMDDVSWASVQPAVRLVAAQARLLLLSVTADKMNDYAVYRVGGDFVSDNMLRLALLGVSRS
jgi:Methyltransferase domain